MMKILSKSYNDDHPSLQAGITTNTSFGLSGSVGMDKEKAVATAATVRQMEAAKADNHFFPL